MKTLGLVAALVTLATLVGTPTATAATANQDVVDQSGGSWVSVNEVCDYQTGLGSNCFGVYSKGGKTCAGYQHRDPTGHIDFEHYYACV
jgi:hypothetical protein